MQNLNKKEQNTVRDITHYDGKVSVVIATYNTAQFLEQAVCSIIEQSVKPLEIIIIDDGSRDDTKAIVTALNHPKVRYCYQTNQGQTAAKNRGLALCRGEFIAFCDADDYWHPQKLEEQLPYFSNPRVGVVYSEIDTINAEGVLTTPNNHETRFSGKVTQQLMVENFVPFGTAIIRRQCYETLSGFNQSYAMGIDWDLWLRYSLVWEFAYCPKKTYIYRIWGGQMSNNHRGRYSNARKILANFIKLHRQQLKPLWIAHAWSDMNIKEATILWKKEQRVIAPLRLYITGLAYRPLSVFGWKSFIKFLLGRS